LEKKEYNLICSSVLSTKKTQISLKITDYVEYNESNSHHIIFYQNTLDYKILKALYILKNSASLKISEAPKYISDSHQTAA